MAYWNSAKPNKENLRLFKAQDSWQAFSDKVEGENVDEGCSRELERHFLNALNSTNLLVLTGAGASFAAKNTAPKKAAPAMSDLLTAVKTKVGDERFKIVVDAVLKSVETKNVEKLLTHCKLYIALHGADDEIGTTISKFIEDSEAAILDRVDFVDETTELQAHEMVLRKIARRGIRKPRAKVFTTNYDLCFENAARRQAFVVLDGFSYTLPQTYDPLHFSLDIVRRDGTKEVPDYFENVFQFYKLHGSLDWRRQDAAILRSRGKEGTPVLIYPRDSKYQEAFEPPYLDMMGAFQAALREQDTTLLVSGFGFNDSHIAQPILGALGSNLSFRLIVCNPSFVPEEKLADAAPLLQVANDGEVGFVKKLLALAKTGDQRLVLINGRFEDLADALPDLVAETERERHATRMKVLRDNEKPKVTETKT